MKLYALLQALLALLTPDAVVTNITADKSRMVLVTDTARITVTVEPVGTVTNVTFMGSLVLTNNPWILTLPNVVTNGF